jgi:hypothetical protein
LLHIFVVAGCFYNLIMLNLLTFYLTQLLHSPVLSHYKRSLVYFHCVWNFQIHTTYFGAVEIDDLSCACMYICLYVIQVHMYRKYRHHTYIIVFCSIILLAFLSYTYAHSGILIIWHEWYCGCLRWQKSWITEDPAFYEWLGFICFVL